MNSAVGPVANGLSSFSLQRFAIAVVMLLCCAHTVFPQMQVEYFWDTDNGLGKNTRVDDVVEISGELSFDLLTDELTPGVHCLGVRAFIVSDTASYYSPAIYSFLIKRPKENIDIIEYFWDNDPGFGNGIAIPFVQGSAVEISDFEPDIKGMTGVHTLCVRAHSSGGWSPLASYLVKVENEKAHLIDTVEYFWDNDPGYGNGIGIPFVQGSAVEISDFEPDIKGMTSIHTLCVRAHSSGGWSPLASYLVKVENEKAHLIDTVEYFWDNDPGYGNGIGIPFVQGSSVEISDFEPDIKGMTGVHTLCVRAHSSGGWSVLYSKEISFSVEGRYTLNEQLPDDTERNFRSIDEMLDFFVARTVTDDVEVVVRDASTFDYDATTADAVGLLAAVVEDLELCNGRLLFSAASSGCINITANDADIKNVLQFASFIDCENVVLKVNGEAYDFSVLAYRTEEVCPGNRTEVREWSAINSDFIVEWKAVEREGCKVTNYIVEGTGDLLAMDVGNSGTDTDYIDYNVLLSKEGKEIISFVYRIIVGPTVADKSIVFTSPTPADGAVADPGTVTFSWKGVGGAHSYVVVVEKTDALSGTQVCDTVVKNAANSSIYNHTFAVETGYNYSYSVMACAKCDSTAYFTRKVYSFRTNDEDIEALKVLYNALGGDNWSKKWLFDAQTFVSTNYQGVTFNSDGRVTAIDLGNSNLAGELPVEGFVLPYLASLDMQKNDITGDVSLFVDECTSLKTLDLSYNRLTKLESALPASITTLYLGGQYYYHYSSVNELDISEILLDKNNIDGILCNDLAWYDHSEGNFSARPNFGIYDRSDVGFKNLIGNIRYLDGNYIISSLNGDYTLVQDADVLLVSYDNVAESSLYPARLSYIKGDANVDAVVDILDVQHILNYVVGVEGAIGMFNRSAANTFEDSALNVQDIIVTVNIILDEENPLMSVANKVSSRSQERTAADACISVSDGTVRLVSGCDVAALDVMLHGVTSSQVELKLNKQRFSMRTRDTEDGVRVVIFSLAGSTIPMGTTDILDVDDNATVSYVKATDIKARSVNIAIDNIGFTDIVQNEEVSEQLSATITGSELNIYTNKELSDVSVELYSIDGKLLYKDNKNLLYVGYNRITIDSVVKGIYLLKISSNNETLYSCCLKQMTN